ncbi:hypothetical protein D3C72_418720 [compost metagenome]
MVDSVTGGIFTEAPVATKVVRLLSLYQLKVALLKLLLALKLVDCPIQVSASETMISVAVATGFTLTITISALPGSFSQTSVPETVT